MALYERQRQKDHFGYAEKKRLTSVQIINFVFLN